MKLTFSFNLSRDTGADSDISDGTHEAHMEVWLVSDALGDLLRSLVQLLRGYEDAWCVWEDDPGEHKWTFHRTGDSLQIRILRFPTSFTGYGAPDEWADVLFETWCPLIKLATKVRNSVRQIIASGLDEEYARRTRGQFPSAQYERLRECIRDYKAETHV